jgi:hypothetical protein
MASENRSLDERPVLVESRPGVRLRQPGMMVEVGIRVQ